MDDRMRTRMAQATRLTRAGKLMEATALIQRTLQGMRSPEASSDTTDGKSDETIDITLQVVDESPEGQTNLNAVSALPSQHDENENASAEMTETSRTPSKNQHAKTATTDQRTHKKERVESALWSKLFACLGSKLSPSKSGLGETVSIPMPNRARSEVWAGGQFLDGSYTNQAGTRSYKLYIPSGYRGQALPLVVMLHGCTQTPEDFAAGSRMNLLAERKLFFVVYPTQTTTANSSKCWNWFKPTDQQRGSGEPSIIAGITNQIASTYKIDARRVYVAGLSAGGAMAAIMGMSYPDLYAAIGVHSGLAYGAAYDLPSAFAAMQHGGQKNDPTLAAGTHTQIVPTIVFHGDLDTTVHPCNGEQVLTQWATSEASGESNSVTGKNLRVSTSKQEMPNGHSYTRSIYHDASNHAVMEQWLVHGAGHGWSGGSPNGSFTDPKGPDASQEMIRFFYEHSLKAVE
ncbi:PHB depolymerase family esterase [Pleurocapsales cyanobacterium LEGE 06147]|nr:PHB depolymerase family esterase [Pleurocapsales cyanobacterium LEGE 06147]